MLSRLSDYSLSVLVIFIFLICHFPTSVVGNDNTPIQSPALVVEEMVDYDEFLPDLLWIIEEGDIPLNPAILFDNKIEDASVINLQKQKTFNLKARKNYWFSIDLTNIDQLNNHAIHFFRTGNCWPWELTFNDVEGFQKQDNNVVSIGITGNSIPASKRDTPNHLNPSIITLNKTAGATSLIWIRLSSAESCKVKVRTKLINNLITLSGKRMTLKVFTNTLTLGAVITILFFTLFFYLKYREEIYAWFLLVLLIQVFNRFFIEFSDQMFQLFFPEQPRLLIMMTTILGALNMISILQFWRVYTRTSEKYSNIHKTIGAVIGTFILLTIVGTTLRETNLSFDFYFKIRQFIMLICLGVLISVNCFLVIKGDALARFISIGISIVMVVTFIGLIVINLDPNAVSGNFRQASGIGHILVLAMAMAYRFFVINEERQVAMDEKIKIEKRNSEQLEKINEASNKFVPNAFLNVLGKKNILQAALGDSKKQDVSILFSDIRNFTTISENLAPKETFKFISDFNKGIGPIITKNNGFINQYLGDGIMAIFPNSAQDALNAALEMKRYEQNTKHLAIRNFDIGIGIHYGSIMMGIMGDEERLDAAIISDDVNLASRIESLTKIYNSSILFSDSFFERLTMTSQIQIRNLGFVKIKGKASKVNLFQTLNYLDEEQIELIESTMPIFNKAIQHLTRKEKSKGLHLLSEVLAINPKDHTTKALIRASRRAEKNAMNDIINSLDELK